MTEWETQRLRWDAGCVPYKLFNARPLYLSVGAATCRPQDLSPARFAARKTCRPQDSPPARPAARKIRHLQDPPVRIRGYTVRFIKQVTEKRHG
ncbi:MAG: hypothetical protein LBQ75_06280 [Zoogloeaceae bacterium]|nr:hypothetical protein [Zoogloeaceae bacterium]